MRHQTQVWPVPKTTPSQRRSRRGRDRIRVRSRLEALEERCLLAVDVSFDSATGVLQIDDRHQNVNQIVLQVLDLGGGVAGIRVNQVPQGIDPLEVTAIRVFGGPGNDAIDLSAVTPFQFPALADGQVTISGDAGRDSIVGSSFGDIIFGGADDDIIRGGGGDDQIQGQSGIDEIHGETGDDLLDVGTVGKRLHHPVVLDTKHVESQRGLGRFSVRFDQSLLVSPTALRLMDANGAAIKLTEANFFYDDTDHTATWDLSQLGLAAPWYSYALDPSRTTNHRGDRLDGNGDGVPGDPFVGKMSTSSPGRSSAPEVIDFQVNSGNGAHAVLWTVDVTFGADVGGSLDPGDLRVRHTVTGNPLVPTSISWDAATRVASWSFAPAEDMAGYYLAEVAAIGVFDSSGTRLAGDFRAAGTNYTRTILVANPGDLNLDGLVSEAEARRVVANLGMIGGTWRDGDHNGDKIITPLDALWTINNLESVLTMRPSLPERMFGELGNDVFRFANPRSMQLIEIHDGGGTDTVDFSLVTFGGLNRLDLSASKFELAWSSAIVTTLQFMTPDAIENVVGTNQADVVLGNRLDNQLSGLGGDDRLEGREGLDVLIGSSGDDTLIGQQGNDLLEGGTGNDTYVFESGNAGLDTIGEEDGQADRLDFSQLDVAVQVDLSSTTLAASRFDSRFQTSLSGGHVEDVVGSNFDDVIGGSESANWLQGNLGNDLIVGRGGDDVLQGGAGIDGLDPGSGLDQVDPGSDFDDPEFQDTPQQVVGSFVMQSHPAALNQSLFVGGTAAGIPPGATDKVRWSFDGLTPGEFELHATWVPVPGAAANTRFQVGELLDTQVDQSISPNGPMMLGRAWQLLGRFEHGSGTTLDVDLQGAGANGYVIADAVRLVRVGELPEFSVLPDVTIPASSPLAVPFTVTYPLGALGNIDLALGDSVPPGLRLTDATVIGDRLYSTIEWPASAARDTGSFLVAVVAVDRVHPTRRVEQSFWATIGAPNMAPVVTPQPPLAVLQGEVISAPIAATDADGPYWELRYSLGAASPPGAVIDTVTGELTWDTATASSGLHSIQIVVTDDGNPPLSDQFVWPVELVAAGPLASIQVPVGQSTTEDSPLTLASASANAISLSGDAGQVVTLVIVATEGAVDLAPAPGLIYELGSTQPSSHVKVRGSIAQLNVALNGLTFHPANNFRGQTVLRVELIDPGNVVRGPSLELREIPISVVPVVEAPALLDQVLYFSPTTIAGGLQVVGTVRAEDLDPDQLLSYRIVTPTTDFSIDPGTGRIVAASDAVLPSGEIDLVVEAYYQLSPTFVDQGVVTIHRVPEGNGNPTTIDDNYFLLEDQLVAGNFVFGDAIGGNGDYDVDGDDLMLVSVTDGQNNPIPFGVPHRAPSGATLVVGADGSVTYDASTAATFDAGYFGSAHEDIFYAIGDEHGATREGGRVSFTVQHVNDLHIVDAQSFAVLPTAGIGSVVGRLVVENAEAAEPLNFAITSGNGGNAFSMDAESGEITVLSPAAISLGQVHALVVEITDADFNVVTATASIRVTDNQLPIVPDAHFVTAADLPVSGNVLTDATGHGIAFDPDGGGLEMTMLDGEAYNLGRPRWLSSGATLVLQDDGSFTYDPSTSSSWRRLAAYETQTERIGFTARDDDGAAVSAELVVTVGGRNWAPRAFDNLYALTNDDWLTGNLIHDVSGMGGRDEDENSDSLALIAANGITFQAEVSFTTRQGAAVLAMADGTFHYDPAGLNLAGLAAGTRVYDSFSYEIVDEFGRTAMAVAKIEVTVSDLDVSRFWISDLRLVNDTTVQGGSSEDDRSEDPRVQGTVAGSVTDVEHFTIEFDLAALSAGGTLQPGSELTVDAATELLPTAATFPDFQFDPSLVAAFGTYGAKAIAYRVAGFDQAGGPVGVSSWDYYEFEWQQPTDQGPLRVSAVRLFHDTAIVDANGNISGHNDKHTTDPRIVGIVAGDFADPPLTGNDTREIRITFEHTRDGLQFTDHLSVSSPQAVMYDPRLVDPALAQNYSDTLALHYAAEVVERIGGSVTSTHLTSGVVEFYYYSVPPSCGAVTLTEVPPPVGGYRGSTRDLTGTAFGNCAPNGDHVYVEFDYADATGSFDDTPDGDRAVIMDATATTPQAEFEYTAVGLPGVEPWIRARVKDWSSEHGAFQYGSWSAPLQLSARVPPGIASTTLDYESSDGRELPRIRGYLVGSVDDNTSGVPTDLSAVGFVGLEFFHRDPGELVFSAAWPVDGNAITDAVGRFEYHPADLLDDQFYRIWVRTVISLSDGMLAHGNPSVVTPDARVASPVLPSVDLLELFDPTVGVLVGDRWRTSDTRIAGAAVQDDSRGVSLDAVEIELAHDYLTVSGDEDTVVGTAAVDADGSFHYAPRLSSGDVNVRARVSYFDPWSATRLHGAWFNPDLSLTVEPRVNLPVTVDALQLVNPIAGSGSPAYTVNPMVAGRVTNPDGYVGWVDIEFRDASSLTVIGTTQTNSDGTFVHSFSGLPAGPVTIDARAFDWDYVTQQLVPGPWTQGSGSLSFTVIPRIANEIATFSLLSDTGPIPGQTANPSLFGTVGGDGPLENLAIAIDRGDDGTIEAMVHPDALGAFYYIPEALPYGQHTYRAKVATWRPELNAFQFSGGAVVTFTLESQPNAAPWFANLGLAFPGATVRDATMVGRVINERNLEGVTIEFDFDASDANGINQTTTTDAYGRFTIVPALAATGPTNIRARTREFDPATTQYLTSGWLALPTFNYQPVDNLPATLTLSLVTNGGGSPPVTSDPTVRGNVQNDGAFENMQVEFAWSPNGPILGITPVRPTGDFEYRLGGLRDGQTYTLWARAREPNGSNFGQFLYSAVVSLPFVFDLEDPNGHYVAALSLLNDTAHHGGTTGDGITEDPTLTGRIAGSQNLDGLTVEFDMNGDSIADATTATNPAGLFEFDPQPAEPGFYSIRARVDASAWNAASLIYDTDDGSIQSRTLASALSLIDADWQTADDLDFDSIRELAGDIFAQGINNAESEYDFAVSVAGVAKQGFEQAVDRQYEQSRTNAETVYRQELAIAQQAFLAALDNLPLHQRPTYALQEFLWPAFAFGNQLVLPKDNDQPALPTPPTYEGPVFDPFQDLMYQDAVWQAEQQLLAARRAAEQTYIQQVQARRNQHRDDIRLVQQAYEAALARASDDLDLALDDHPDLDDTQYQAKVDAIAAAWQSYANAVQAAEETSSARAAAAIQRRDQALANAAEDYFNASMCDPGTPPTIASTNACTDRNHAATRAYDAAERQIAADFRRKTAVISRDRSVARANALQAAQLAVIDLERQLRVIVRQHELDTHVDLLNDTHAYSVAHAWASATLARDLAEADETLAKALADLLHDKNRQIAQQERQTEQAISAAQRSTVQNWSMMVATPWGAYQAVLANLEDSYRQAVIGFKYERHVALSGAVRFEAHARADAVQDQEDALANSNKTRTVQLAALTRDYRADLQQLYSEQDTQLAEFWAINRTSTARAQGEQAVAVAEFVETNGIAIADAQEVNAQPGDVWHVRCIPNSDCSHPTGWESFRFTDNSAIRERNRIAYLRRTADAQLDRSLAQANADQDFDHARIDATKTYRTATNSRIRDTTVAQAGLRFTYEVDVAAVQDDYNLAVATAAATYVIDLAKAEAGRTSSQVTTGVTFDDRAVLEKRSWDIAAAELAQTFHVSLASGHVSAVAAWGATQPGSWGTYQFQLAQAELNRVSAVQAAELDHVLRGSSINVTAIRQDGAAELAFAATIFGANGALVARTTMIAGAYVDMAEDHSLEEYVRAQSLAVKQHDIGVASATLAYRRAVVNAEARRDDRTSDALRNRQRAVARAAYALVVEPGDTNLSELLNSAYAAFIRTTARPNAELVLTREQARRNWKLAVGELNLQQASDIIDSQIERAERIRSDAITLATSVAEAARKYTADEALADSHRGMALATAEARESIQSVDSAAIRALELVAIQGQTELDRTSARGIYEVGLHNAHRVATAAYRNAVGTLESIYFADLALVDYNRAVAEANARLLYHQAVADIQFDRQFQRNDADTSYARQKAAATVEFTSLQTTADRNLATTVALAFKTFHVSKETAKAELTLGNARTQGAADRASAAAARDRDERIAGADLAFAQTITAAQADLAVACATAFWYFSTDCLAETAAYDDVLRAANRRRGDALDRAGEGFQRRLRGIETVEAEDVAEFRIQYVTAVGTAQVAFANRQASGLADNARASASNNVNRIRREAQATRVRTLDVALAEYRFTVGVGQEDVLFQQRQRDVASLHGFQQGVAEGTYQIERSASLALQWRALATANPSDSSLQFQAAQSEAAAVWFSYLGPAIASDRQLSIAAAQQLQVDLQIVQAAHDANRSLAEQSYAIEVAHQRSSLAISQAIAELHHSVGSANNRSAISVGTATAELDHAIRYVQADTRHWTSLVLIQHRFDEDGDEAQRTNSIKQADYARSVSLAGADAIWRTATRVLERKFALGEAAREFTFTTARAAIQRDYELAESDAERVRELAIAQSQASSWIGQTTAQNQYRIAEAVAEDTLLSSSHAAHVSALATLEVALPIPWAAFEHDRAQARQSAWTTLRGDYLALQHDIGTQELLFTAQRSAAYIATATDIAWANHGHDAQRAILIADAIRSAAGGQQAFAVDLARLTDAYRASVTEAERIHDVAIALATRDTTSTVPANNEHTAAIEMAEDVYEEGMTRLSRTRRETLARDGFELTSASNALRLQLAEQITIKQAALHAAVSDAYLDSTTDSGLEAVKANLIHAFVLQEAATLVTAMAGIASSPWSELAMADTIARQTHYVGPLADLQRQQRKSLAEARSDYHTALTTAALTFSQAMEHWDAVTSDLQGAGQVALVATFDDGDIVLPVDVTPPTPDIVAAPRLTARYSATYAGVRDIDFYGHPGFYTPWNTNLWYANNYLDVSWLWSNHGQFSYGWSGSLYSGSYGSPGGFYSGEFLGGYYGNWNYTPWTFSWNGWSGGYVTPPAGIPNGFGVDVPGALRVFGQSVAASTNHALATTNRLSKAEDERVPTLDALSGRIQLGDTATVFQARRSAESTAAISLADFTDVSNTRSLDTRATDLATVATPVAAVQPAATPTVAASANATANSLHDVFNHHFEVSVAGRAVYVEEYRIVKGEPLAEYNPYVPAAGTAQDERQLVRKVVAGFVDNHGWIQLSGAVGHGRARLTALQTAAARWNGPEMKDVLRAAFAADPSLASNKSQLNQLIGGIRSPYRVEEQSPSIGIFIGGTDMHFYGVGNVERMYNQYSGTKFYYGGVGNAVDSEHPLLEGATASSEFEGNLDYMVADILKYGRGKQVHIFGWSRGAAQAIELARRLGGEGISVDFAGLFDPVYSVGLPGQQSNFVMATPAGKLNNYVTAEVPINVRTAVAIYAMNEVRSYFPATYLEPESSAATDIVRIGSPGAHGEVGGHWASNRWVQQLNFHVMMKYAEDRSTANFLYWDGDRPFALDSQIQAIYQSNYTTFLGLRTPFKDGENFRTATVAYENAWRDQSLWQGFAVDKFVDQANSRVDFEWSPSKLGAQHTEDGHNSLAFALEAVLKQDAVGNNVIAGGDGSEVLRQDHRNHYRRRLGWIDKHLWQTYPGIKRSFIESLYERVIDPDDGGWKKK